MAHQRRTSILAEHRLVVIVIALGLFLLEMEVLAVFSAKSGKKASLQVLNGQGQVVYETDGNHLSSFDKYYFEKTFGPFEQFETRLLTTEVPFPFRAWFVAAVGIPVGVMLLFGFLVKAVAVLFFGEKPGPGPCQAPRPESGTRLEKGLARISRFNIFVIGFLMFLAVLGYWVVPNLIVYVGKTGTGMLVRFKWVFWGLGAVMTGIFIWIVYLRYLLARKTIEQQGEVEKFRLQLAFGRNDALPPRLGYDTEKMPHADHHDA